MNTYKVVKTPCERAEVACAAGVMKGNILIYPGIGFGKRRQDNIDPLSALPRLADLGYPLLFGTSRKSFMGTLCDEPKPHELVGATCPTTALGVRVLHVHDVKANRQILPGY